MRRLARETGLFGVTVAETPGSKTSGQDGWTMNDKEIDDW